MFGFENRKRYKKGKKNVRRNKEIKRKENEKLESEKFERWKVKVTNNILERYIIIMSYELKKKKFKKKRNIEKERKWEVRKEEDGNVKNESYKRKEVKKERKIRRRSNEGILEEIVSTR